MDVSAGAEFEKLIELMAKLCGPNGCSWDREQTMASLRAFVLEEAYELVDAIGQNNTEGRLRRARRSSPRSRFRRPSGD